MARNKELGCHLPRCLPRSIDSRRSRSSLRLREPNSCDLRIENRRTKETLRLQKSRTLRVLQRSCGSGSRTFCRRARDAKRAHGRAKLPIRKGISEPRSRCALGNALRRLPTPRHRVLTAKLVPIPLRVKQTLAVVATALRAVF